MSAFAARSPTAARALLQRGEDRLRQAGIANARREAEWLLGRLTNRRPLELCVDDPEVASPLADTFFSQIAARAEGEPLQYLMGDAEFFGELFEVGPDVLIPRPETEALVSEALKALRPMAQQAGRPLRLLDLGTGSGCIAVTLAKQLPACVVVAVDVSWNALQTARRNVRRHGVLAQVRLVHGRWAQMLRGSVDGIIANPPYVPSDAVARLPADVLREPRAGLDGGADGLRDLFDILNDAPRLLRAGGLLMMECAEDQAARVSAEAAARPWVGQVALVRDLASRLRGVLLHTQRPFATCGSGFRPTGRARGAPHQQD